MRGDPIARFWSYVDKSSTEHPDGWLWTGEIESNGYGRIYVDGKRQGAHRFAYELLVGPIPEGLTVDHQCHNRDAGCRGLCVHRRCVRPEHLILATYRENVLASRGLAAENARKTHCKQGHPFDEVNTYLPPSGRRVCRACGPIFRERYLAKKRGG